MILSEARELTQERLKELLDYDSLTGSFRRKVKLRGGRPKADGTDTVGCIAKNGYWQIGVDGRHYLAHRLVWLYVHGNWPSQIDHRNMNRCDNRLANLREATPSENAAHSGPRNGKKFKGAHRFRNVWKSAITKDRKEFYLGVFSTEQEAHCAYIDAARRMYGEFAGV